MDAIALASRAIVLGYIADFGRAIVESGLQPQFHIHMPSLPHWLGGSLLLFVVLQIPNIDRCVTDALFRLINIGFGTIRLLNDARRFARDHGVWDQAGELGGGMLDVFINVSDAPRVWVERLILQRQYPDDAVTMQRCSGTTRRGLRCARRGYALMDRPFNCPSHRV